MLCRVFKGAFGQAFVAKAERLAHEFPAEAATVVEDADYNTRRAEVRWIRYGTAAFAYVEREIYAVLEREGLIDPRLCAIENFQYTVYRPGCFHDWHIDAYRRSYNQYDTALGTRFLGKKRKLSLSVLLNDATEFKGGEFEVSMFPNGRDTVGTALKDFARAGDLAIFDSALCHRVAPVGDGERRSLVAWVCG